MCDRIGTLVIGATAFGSGYALSHGGVTLAEESLLLCTEFSSAYRYGKPYKAGLSEAGKSISDEFVQRGLTDSEGRISVPAATGVFAERLLGGHVPVMLMCRVLSVENAGGFYRVVYYNTDGFGELECEKLIDTTSVGTPDSASAKYSPSVSLRAQLGGCGKDIENYNDGCVFTEKGPFDNEYVFCVKLDTGETGRIESRRKLLAEWNKLKDGPFEGRSLSVISAFQAYEYPSPVCEKISHGWYFVPSSSYGSIIEAFEEGIKCGI